MYVLGLVTGRLFAVLNTFLPSLIRLFVVFKFDDCKSTNNPK